MTAMDPAEREVLRQVASEFLSKASDSSKVRGVIEAGGVPDRRLASEMAEMGWFALEVPESHGGIGARFEELVILLTEMGGYATASPLLSTAVLCAGAIILGGSPQQQERWLPRLAAGTCWGAAVLPACFEPPQSTTDRVIARRDAGGWSLTGSMRHVLDARISSMLVVAARADSGWVVGLVRPTDPGVRIEAVSMTDATRCVDSVQLDQVWLADADVLSADAKTAASLLGILVNRAAVGIAADSVGNSRRVLDMTVTYARQREQFGRPIGSFQAVKHRAADMLVDAETSQALTEDAARAVGAEPAVAAVPASMSKEYACEKAAFTAGAGIQLHGGIGYTWEHDLHIYLKRSKLNEQLFGNGRWHRARIAAALMRRNA